MTHDPDITIVMPLSAAIAANRAVSNHRDHLLQSRTDNPVLIRSLNTAGVSLTNALLSEGHSE